MKAGNNIFVTKNKRSVILQQEKRFTEQFIRELIVTGSVVLGISLQKSWCVV